MQNNIIIICGPTASGKSTFAMEMAKSQNGAIINADSMQIYKEIPVLTASPSKEDKNTIPHHLYNYISLQSDFSVAKYMKDAFAKIKEVEASGLLPIVVGGTGLYIHALIKGINNIPDIDSDVRTKTESMIDSLGKEEFHSILSKVDPDSASKIKIGDRQRMIRAYEVWMQTGKTIKSFQDENTEAPLKDYNISIIMLSPERGFLYKRCDERFRKLVDNGGLEEVKALMQYEDINTNALGFKELKSHSLGEISLEDAIILAQNKTRQYAKRQLTWFNNQIADKMVVSFSSEEEFARILSEIKPTR